MTIAAWLPWARLLGVAALVIGMILVFAGVRMDPLFLPGVFILDIAFLLLIGAGSAALVSADSDARSA